MPAAPSIDPEIAAGTPGGEAPPSAVDSPVTRPPVSSIDRRAWFLAMAGSAVALLATAAYDALIISLRTGDRLPGHWFALVDWSTFGWYAAGLVLVAAVGWRWSGSWSLYLLWAMPSVCWGLSGVLAPMLDTWAGVTRDTLLRNDRLPLASLATAAAGGLLLSAAVLQARAWRRSLRALEGGGPAAPLRRFILGGWVALMVAYVVVGATSQDVLGSPFDILVATAVAAVAWQIGAVRQGAAWVFALAGVYLVGDGVQAASYLAAYPASTVLMVPRHWLFEWPAAIIATALVQIAWGGAVLAAAWRLQSRAAARGEPVEAPRDSGVDARAWWAASAALVGAIATIILTNAFRYSLAGGRWLSLDRPPTIAWMTAAWIAVGLVIVFAAGRRWARVWVIYLMWSIPLLYWGLTGMLEAIPMLDYYDYPVRLFSFGEPLPDDLWLGSHPRRRIAAADLFAVVFGILLAYAAVRQARVWRRGLAPAAGRPLPAAHLALVLAGWVALVATYVIARSFSVLLVGDVRDLMLATAVAAVALLVAYMPRGAVWVFAVAGAYFASFAIADLVAIAVDRHLSWGVLWLGAAPIDALWRHRFLAATLLSGVVQLAWAVVLLVLAWRLASSDGGRSVSAEVGVSDTPCG